MFCDNSPKKPQADPPPVALLHGASHNASANTLRPPPRIPYSSHSPICPSAHRDSLGTGQLSPLGSFPRILSRTQRPGFNRLCSSRVAFFGLVTFLVSRPFVNVIGWVMF